ncbi:MAG: LysM peptidoglycan-binding domain-containing protein [Alphaproteobacteria bacterium]|nr:LysM peptidoglycan-binding domain-containing protein [Alphaproteobacteria bacterium]
MERPVAVLSVLVIVLAIIVGSLLAPEDWYAGKPPAASGTTERAGPAQRRGEAPLPSFDVVRVDPAGTSVIAGRAEPGAEIVISANGVEIGRVTASDRGDWVAYIATPLESGNQELTLLMRTVDGREVKGEERVVVAVPARPGEQPLVVLSDGTGASRVLQAPGDQPEMRLSLEALDYDAQGGVIFSGRGEAGGVVRLYVDEVPVGDAVVDTEGRWTLRPDKPIAPGVHTMRIDQVTPTGQVSARVELPFERAAPEGIVMTGGKIIVQPGNSLWRIANSLYGTGFRYTVIYEANKNQIGDPDLIYPGQIFIAPNLEEPAVPGG